MLCAVLSEPSLSVAFDPILSFYDHFASLCHGFRCICSICFFCLIQRHPTDNSDSLRSDSVSQDCVWKFLFVCEYFLFSPFCPEAEVALCAKWEKFNGFNPFHCVLPPFFFFFFRFVRNGSQVQYTISDKNLFSPQIWAVYSFFPHLLLRHQGRTQAFLGWHKEKQKRRQGFFCFFCAVSRLQQPVSMQEGRKQVFMFPSVYKICHFLGLTTPAVHWTLG